MTTFFSLIILIGIGILIVGIILFIVDYAKDKSKKTSLIVGTTGIVTVLFSAMIIKIIDVHQQNVEKAQEAENEKIFKTTANKFLNKYEEIGPECEDLGNTEYDYWGDDIDNSSYDDYDPSDTITSMVEDNADDIITIDSDMQTEKKLLKTLSEHKNDKYDYTKYKKAYDHLDQFADMVTSPLSRAV